MDDSSVEAGGPFRFEYEPGVLRGGGGAVDALEEELAALGVERALIVCGRTVGQVDAVIEPVTEGIGERLAGVFAETTPAKRLSTALSCRRRMAELDADGLVGLGGGSSLDVATVASVVAASDREDAALAAEFADTGTLTVPEGPLVPIVSVPTTMAGADFSAAAGLTADPTEGLVSEPVDGGVSDPRLMPGAAIYDPALFATTPPRILAASAINGFDKGVESLYARTATPVTDATAMRGLSLLVEGLEEYGQGTDGTRTTDASGVPAETFDRLVRGLVLVQYGVSRPDATTLSIVHAFGHALSRPFPLQQGMAHGVVLPHVLEYLFERVDGRRALLAEALGVGDREDPGAAVVEQIEALLETLGVDHRLRDVDGPDRESLPVVAEAVMDDHLMATVPRGLDPTVEDMLDVLQAAW